MPHAIKKIFFTYFWLPWVFIAVHGLSLVVASRGLLFVAVPRLLIAVSCCRAQALGPGFSRCGAWTQRL